MPTRVLNILAENFEVSDEVVLRTQDRLGFGDWSQLTRLHRPELKDAPYSPHNLWRNDEDPEVIFDQIRYQDILVHHPFESFASVETFLRAAVQDPHVTAIKMTLYRIGSNSPLIPLLIAAAEAGKQVAVLVELKARFDERNNILWAKRLETHGIHVVYGFANLKTHSKLCLVVRQEADGVQRYVHTGTGNYNPDTAKIYTDLGLFTADPDIVNDVSDVFNYLTGYSNQKEFRALIVAPVQLRQRIKELIEREIEHAQAGRPARLMIKVNAVTDDQMIRLLYRAAQSWRLDGPDGARHLLPASGRARCQRQHPRALDRRPLPRAFPHLLVPQQRAGRDVHRERRPDGAQSRPARRDAGTDSRPRDPGAPAGTSCSGAYLRDIDRAMVLDSSGHYERPPTGPITSTPSSSWSGTTRTRSASRRLRLGLSASGWAAGF